MCVVCIPRDKVTTSSNDLLVYLKSISHHGNIIILGDFNLPDINWDYLVGSSPFSNDFWDFVFDNNLVQLVCGPTHNLGNTLDLVLTNVPHLIDNVSIESHGLTEMYDHFVVTFSISTLAGYNDYTTCPRYNIYNFSQADYDGLLSYLLQYDFTSVCNRSDIESAYLEFSTIIYQAIDRFVPTVKTRRHKSPKWFTPEIHNLKNCLHTAHKRYT